MKKKLLAASLAAVTLSAILTGCSGKGLASYDDDDWDTSGTGIGKTDSQSIGSKNNGSDVKPTDLLDINGGEVVSCASNAKNVSVPSGVISLADNVFADHTELVTVSLPDGLTQIGSGAFSGCTNLFSLYIPDGVTKIPDNAFEGCSSLAAVYIPESVTEIGKNAFEGCSALTYLGIPSTVKSLAEDAFNGCGSLTANYMTVSFAPRDLINLCDIVNGNYKRVDMPYKQAREIIGDLRLSEYDYRVKTKIDTFDDINAADIYWLIKFINAKSYDILESEFFMATEPGTADSSGYKFTDIDKCIKEHLNPDFDINIWKKNTKQLISDDGYFMIPRSQSASPYTVNIEDCYSVGHKTYITIEEYDGLSSTLTNDFLKHYSPQSSGNTRYRFTYRNDNGKYYLEAVEEVTVNDLEPWNQSMIKVLDEFRRQMNMQQSGVTPSSFYFADANNDGTMDFVVACSNFYNDWVFDGKDGSYHPFAGVGWLPGGFKKDTITNRYVYMQNNSIRYEGTYLDYYDVDQDYKRGDTSLCSSSDYTPQFGEDHWSKREIGGKSVSTEEYNEYVKRFEDIPSTDFSKITVSEFIEAFRAAFS